MDMDKTVSTCSVCLEPAEQSGGRPLYSPGCCGSWLHMECANAMAKSVSCTTRCPHCRAAITLPNLTHDSEFNTDQHRFRRGGDRVVQSYSQRLEENAEASRASPTVPVSTRTYPLTPVNGVPARHENRITTATTSQVSRAVTTGSATANGTSGLVTRLPSASSLARPAADIARAGECINRGARCRRRTRRSLEALSVLIRAKETGHLVTGLSHLYYDDSVPVARTANDALSVAALMQAYIHVLCSRPRPTDRAQTPVARTT
jgi:hypothetical protein